MNTQCSGGSRSFAREARALTMSSIVSGHWKLTRRRGRQSMRWLTWWTWVWPGSRSWWWTAKFDEMQSMGSQSQTWLINWTELNLPTNYHFIKHLHNFFAGKMLLQSAGGRKCFARVCQIPKHRILCYRNKQIHFSLAKKCVDCIDSYFD